MGILKRIVRMVVGTALILLSLALLCTCPILRLTGKDAESVLADADFQVTDSLDFGTPAEVAIPDVSFAEGSSIYEQFWQTYIRDRYDDDSRVMVCKVNLGGYQVNEDLLRNFYYFDGCLWALNRIINHSLSTWDDTECEFIKVQDKDNYTT